VKQARFKQVSAVLFDFGGSLDAEGIPWKARFFRLYRDEGVAIPAEQFDQAFYQADDALTGAIPATLSFSDTVLKLAQEVSQALGLRDPTLTERIAVRFLTQARNRLATNAALLQRLSSRYRLGLVSNFYGNLTTVCHEVGLSPSLAVIVDSEQVGFIKPDPQIFLLALAELKCDSAHAVFVGDSMRRDMAGARELGMRHIWLKSDCSEEQGPCCPNDPVIHSLAELRALLL
jgi:haloacid dehalogenase superfamily, subfamily IA, variant 1 with third motif having Dx(3-4)D or Dx(3-4)E